MVMFLFDEEPLLETLNICMLNIVDVCPEIFAQYICSALAPEN